MTSKKFTEQLYDLLQNAPKDSVAFVSYKDKESGKKIEFIKGTAVEIITDLSILLTDREDLQKIFTLSIDAAKQDFSKEYKRSLK